MQSEQSPEEWLNGVLREFEAPLLSFAFRLTRNWDDARDVVQETFLALCETERGRVESKLAQWLFYVCRTKALKLRERTARARRLARPDAAVLKQDAGDQLENSEAISEIQELVNSLPEREQELIWLKFHQGFSSEEMAGVVGISAENVRFLLHRALKRIRQKLHPKLSDQ